MAGRKKGGNPLAGRLAHSARVLGKVHQIDRSACRRRVEHRFSIDTMVAGYEQVYAKIFELEALR